MMTGIAYEALVWAMTSSYLVHSEILKSEAFSNRTEIEEKIGGKKKLEKRSRVNHTKLRLPGFHTAGYG